MALIHQQDIDQSDAYQVNFEEVNLNILGHVLSLDRQKKEIRYQGPNAERILSYQQLMVVTDLEDCVLGLKLLILASKLQETFTPRILASHAQAAKMRSHKLRERENDRLPFQKLMSALEFELIDIRERFSSVFELQVSLSN